jgi:hypothetical protein
MIVAQHEVRATTSTGLELTVLDGSTITADRAWTPHVQGRLEIAPPASYVGPGRRLTVELTQRFGSLAITRDLSDLYGGLTTAALTTQFGGDTTADITALITASAWNDTSRAATGRQFELMVTKSTKRLNSWSLEVASCEALFIDALNPDLSGSNEAIARQLEGPDTPSMVRSAFFSSNTCGHHIAGGYPTLTAPVSLVEGRTAGLSTPLVIEPLANIWATVMGVLVSVGQRLYSRGDWALILTEQNPETAGEITVEPGVNLIDWELAEELIVDTLVRWDGSQTDPNARPVWGTSTGGISFTNVTARLIDVPAPLIGWPPLGPLQLGFPTPAASYAEQAGLDRSPLRLTVINDYSIMPWSSITYTLPDESPTTTIIDAITWQLAGRFEMEVWV